MRQTIWGGLMAQEHATLDGSAHNTPALALQPINTHLQAGADLKTILLNP